MLLTGFELTSGSALCMLTVQLQYADNTTKWYWQVWTLLLGSFSWHGLLPLALLGLVLAWHIFTNYDLTKHQDLGLCYIQTQIDPCMNIHNL